MTETQKVAVAMSGGVDSSVAAALLKGQGFEVIGMMLRLWSEPGKEDSNRCCTPEAMTLARRAAALLDIPFYVIDAKVAFEEIVVGAFLKGYASGVTPNPCLECNRQIRWTILLEHAVALGAGRMATGHYARVERGADGLMRLLRARYAAKDQSYVLHVLTQRQLERALFPIGNYSKEHVRELAARFGLPSAARPDSQDLCFLAGSDYRDFLRRRQPDMLVPGEIVDAQGHALGGHDGLVNYTIGQRRGLNVRSNTPLYVIRKEAETNRLVVGRKTELGHRHLTAGPVNWISGSAPGAAFAAQVKTRYTALEQSARVTPSRSEQTVRIAFDEPQRDITPGQAAVFLQGDVVVGGGLIQAASQELA
jgi:tRNA-specific 2-thiouridylase